MDIASENFIVQETKKLKDLVQNGKISELEFLDSGEYLERLIDAGFPARYFYENQNTSDFKDIIEEAFKKYSTIYFQFTSQNEGLKVFTSICKNVFKDERDCLFSFPENICLKFEEFSEKKDRNGFVDYLTRPKVLFIPRFDTLFDFIEENRGYEIISFYIRTILSNRYRSNSKITLLSGTFVKDRWFDQEVLENLIIAES